MKRIVVKEIDKLKSSTFDNKTISEYLIYLIINLGDGDIILNGFTEIGDKNKEAKIDELIVEHFVTNDSLEVINKESIIEEISFSEYTKNK